MLSPLFHGSGSSCKDLALNDKLTHVTCVKLILCLELRKELEIPHVEKADIFCFQIFTLIFFDTHILYDRQRKFIITDMESFPPFTLLFHCVIIFFVNYFLLLVQCWSELLCYLFQQFIVLWFILPFYIIPGSMILKALTVKASLLTTLGLAEVELKTKTKQLHLYSKKISHNLTGITIWDYL